MHSVEVLHAEAHHLGVLTREDSELPLEQVFPEEPLVELHVLLLERATNDVDNSEGVSWYVRQVPRVLVLRKNLAAVAPLEEVDTVDRVALEVDVLVLLDDDRFEEGADPGEE